MNTEVMFSSQSVEWETPLNLFYSLDKEFNFNLDVCATAENKKCQAYFDKQTDGLKQSWIGNCWMNPPYGRKIGLWVEKAWKEVAAGNAKVVVCLLPARTDTKWFHEYCNTKGIIRFLKGRLRFNNHPNPAPFPSMIVIFKP